MLVSRERNIKCGYQQVTATDVVKGSCDFRPRISWAFHTKGGLQHGNGGNSFR